MIWYPPKHIKIYSHELAFSVGGNYFPAGLHKQDWEAMAKDFSVNPKAIFKQLGLIKNKISHVIQSNVFKEKLIQRGLTKENFVKLEQVELLTSKSSAIRTNYKYQT